MTRQECFKILRLEPSAGPSAIKQAYRKLAFELHPDLNPNLPEAGKRFQELNEAYVLLMQEYANTSYGSRAKEADHSGAAGHADEKARAEAHKAYEQAKSRFTSAAGGFKNEASGPAQGENSQSSPGSTAPPGGKGPRVGGRKPSREEILRDLLDDPFARRVFEDIYSHVRHNKGQQTESGETAKKPPNKAKAAAAKHKPRKRKKAKPAGTPMLIAAGSKMAGLAGSMASGMKSWFRKQIDDEQIMYLPGESLYPGARVRLQVRHGFSEKSRTIEFSLPPEFQPGRPIRLKGLGKHLGSLQGDLYLRVYSREELEEGETDE